MMQEADNPLIRLAGFAATRQFDNCPAPVLEKARALLLYGLAVGVTSAKSQIALRGLTAARREYGGAGCEATCLLDGGSSACGAAAFANAVLLHVRIQDDAHPAGHLGTIVLPAALAVAQYMGSSGRDLLAAIVSGYEVGLRIGRDHAADLSSRGLRTTSVYGVVGAAAACARLLQLDTHQTMCALAFTTHCAGGLREFADAGTDEYPLQAGFSARNGITAALLAQTGLVGTQTAFTGKAGLLSVFGDPKKDYAPRLAKDLGVHYETQRVTYKPYPGGQFHRGVIRGFIELSRQAGGEALASAEVHMHPFEANYLGLRYAGPFHTYTQTFFSVPFCAGLAWRTGTVSFDGLNRFDDRGVLDLVSRVSVVADPARERYKPYLRVALQNGKVIEWQDEAGEGSYDLSWEVAVRMTQQFFVETGVDERLADALIAAVADIGKAASVAPLIRAAIDVTTTIVKLA